MVCKYFNLNQIQYAYMVYNTIEYILQLYYTFHIITNDDVCDDVYANDRVRDRVRDHGTKDIHSQEKRRIQMVRYKHLRMLGNIAYIMCVHNIKLKKNY